MNTIYKLPYLTVVFKNEIKPSDIPAFRGAVISKVPRDLTLFHNHLSDGFRFSYPLIQYKSIGGKAALCCIGEGTDAVSRFFEAEDFNLDLRGYDELFEVDDVWAKQWILQPWDGSFHYSIRRWLPLNKNNYEKFQTIDGIIDRMHLLESVLIGNILSMAKGVGYQFKSPIKCDITRMNPPVLYTHKGVKFQGYNVQFKTNIYLPDYIGLGKGASMGFGIVKSINQKHSNDRDRG